MILGMSLAAYTQLHVIISLIGILSGLVVLASLLTGKLPRIVNALFLITTVLTSAGGYLFPFTKILPSHIVGVISLLLLAVAIYALYRAHLVGGWRKTYVIAAMAALYLNCFVLVVQLFLKVPAIHALAPTQSEPPFAIAQITVMILFIVLIIIAVKKFRIQQT
jgi:hypothetical protein